jgi:Ca-activated chloride channel family protein
MKPTQVALLSALGMLLTSVSVYSITPPGGFSRSAGASASAGASPDNAPTATQAAQADNAHFTAGANLMVEGRLGHAKLAKNAAGETFVMLEVRGADGVAAPKNSAPVNLALVIDRSGSMKGTRIRNAVSAATSAVDRLSDGDVVSVVTFDTQTQVVVPPTAIGQGARERVNAAIRGITLGGDTCISCGIEEAMSQLQQTSGKVSRMLLLSDGDANHGVRDVPGFRSIAQRAQARGVSVTTIGVDVEYNEKIMTAIALDSNGRHYFVENDAALPRIFEQEAESLTRTIASNVEATIELAPGVELERVFDRSFRRAGNQVIVPLGSFSGPEVKTVLLKVRAPKGSDGVVPIANVDLGWRDLVTGSDGRCQGKLAVEMVADASQASDLDALVAGRVQRSETASVLKDANALFEQGKVAEARRALTAREDALRAAADKAKRAAPATRKAEVDQDFQRQIAAVGDANQGFNAPEFATPPPGAAARPAAPAQETRAGKSAVKQNAARTLDMAF